MLNLGDLPEIDFVEADAQNIEKTIFALYTSVTGRNLAEGDPIRLFLLFICDVIIRLLEKLNYTGKQNLLKYAEGDKLENLGALVGVTRIPASAASAAFQIRLSEARDKETIIPKGTRIGAEGDIYGCSNQHHFALPKRPRAHGPMPLQATKAILDFRG